MTRAPYERRPVGLRMRDGRRLGFSTWVHPCPIIERVRFQYCEAEVEQAIDRLRLLRGEGKRLVLVINECPAQVTVDMVVNYRRAVLRNRLAEAVTELDGFLPGDRKWLAARLPHLFKNSDTVKEALDYELRLMGENPISIFIGNSPIIQVMARAGILAPLAAPRYVWRRKGQHGPHDSTVYSWHPPKQVRAWLEDRFGEIVKFVPPMVLVVTVPTVNIKDASLYENVMSSLAK